MWIFGVFEVKVYTIFFGTQAFSARRDARHFNFKQAKKSTRCDVA